MRRGFSVDATPRERELCTFAYSLLQLVVDSIREVEEEDSNPPTKKRKQVVSVFDIEKVLGNCKRLPGWNAVYHPLFGMKSRQQSRSYEGNHCHTRKPNEVHHLLCKEELLVEQEDV